MNAYLVTEMEYLLRILCAVVCGMLIGYERDNHMKMAGIRTHSIVALTAALMMIISKYGFFDVLGSSSNIRLDPSRTAAGIVTAIGFLGAGVIFNRKQNISGLTTAAGIWAVVGIGMAFGAGLYLLGGVCTLCIIILHMIFHRNFRWMRNPSAEEVIIELGEEEDVTTILNHLTSDEKAAITNVQIDRTTDGMLRIKLLLMVPENHSVEEIVALLRENPHIKSINL